MANEWDSEPAEFNFVDDASGLKCAMRRGPGGNWCGYVAVPKGHPIFGKDYSDPVTVPSGYMDRDVSVDADYGAIALFTASLVAKPDENIWPLDLAVRCHGGLTYAGNGWGAMQDGSWWLGFDCAHSGDLVPNYSHFGGDVYRNEAYVRASIEKLCGDIVAISASVAQEA